MRCLVFCISWWNSQDEFNARYGGYELFKVDPLTSTHIHQFHTDYDCMFGLKAWLHRVDQWFPGAPKFIACGTWSDPAFSCFGSRVTIVNSGALPDHPYTGSWNYSTCAFTAAMAYALNRNDWDLLVMIDDDVLFGAIDWDTLLHDFLSRNEEVLGLEWCGRLGYIIAYKRAAAIRYLHQRIRPNLSESDATGLPLPEDEFDALYKGRVWYPWPDLYNIRQDFGHDAEKYVNPKDTLTWPMIRLPHPSIIPEYIRTQTSRSKPVLYDRPAKA